MKHSRYADVVRFISDGTSRYSFNRSGVCRLSVARSLSRLGIFRTSGVVTLSILMLPYILRTTELSIRRVPDGIREGAVALGSSKIFDDKSSYAEICPAR